MSVVKRAVQDAKDVARLSIDAAKNELIDQMAPAIKRIVEEQLRAGTLGEDLDRIRRHEDGYGDDCEEGKSMDKQQVGSVSEMFPEVSEVTEGDDEMEEAKGADDEMDEAAPPPNDDMDEEFEISEAELESMYAEALKLEVDVSKGFKDMSKPHELGAGAKAQYQSDPNNLETLKSGEHEWDDEEPPAKKNWMPEDFRRMVKEGIAENKRLVSENRKLTEMVKKMHGRLKETNLLNSKILHVNRFLTGNRLTTEQKRTVIESIDKGRTVAEVKTIYGILESTFRASGTVSEGRRRPHADSQKLRTGGAPNAQVLRESADKAQGEGPSRWKQLAGIVGGK